MSIRLVVFDNVTPLLDEMAKISVGVANQSLSKAGAHIQREARKSMRSKTTMYHVEKKGKIQILTKGESKELGLRMVGDTIANPSSMANFITSYQMPKDLLVVVGGRHKAFTPFRYQDGKVVGNMSRQKGIGSASHGIIHKLNFGGTLAEQTDGYKKTDRRGLESKKFRGYHFMEEGFKNAQASINKSMTKDAELIFHTAVKNTNVKTRIVS